MESDETLNQEPTLADVMRELAKINERLGGIDKRLDGYDSQFEAIRQGLVANNVAFDRLQSTVFSMRADLNELKEEIRRKELV